MQVIFDDNGLLARLDGFERTLAREWDAESNAAMNEARRLLQRYPSPPAGSTYTRTFELQRGWNKPVRRVGRFGKVLANETTYGPFVQQRQTQARVHKGRWQTVEDVLEQVDVNKAAERAAEATARKIEGR